MSRPTVDRPARADLAKLVAGRSKLRRIRRLVLQLQRGWRRGLGKESATIRREALKDYQRLRQLGVRVMETEAYTRVVDVQSDEFQCARLIMALYHLPQLLALELPKLRSQSRAARRNASTASQVLGLYAGRTILSASARETLLKAANEIEQTPSLAAESQILSYLDPSLIGKHHNQRALAIRHIASLVPAETTNRYATIASLLNLAAEDGRVSTLRASSALVRSTLLKGKT